MAYFNININTDNDAFYTDADDHIIGPDSKYEPQVEIARILRNIADRVEAEMASDEDWKVPISDINGLKVGKVRHRSHYKEMETAQNAFFSRIEHLRKRLCEIHLDHNEELRHPTLDRLTGTVGSFIHHYMWERGHPSHYNTEVAIGQTFIRYADDEEYLEKKPKALDLLFIIDRILDDRDTGELVLDLEGIDESVFVDA